MKRSSKAARRTTESTNSQGIFEITGVIKKWDAKKGYGFVKPYDGQQIVQDIFLHISCLEKNAVISVGAEIVCMAQTSRLAGKNPEAVEVLRLELATNPGIAPEEGSAPSPKAEGAHVGESCIVKFFNAEKGFGFLKSKKGGVDFFFNNATLRRSGLQPDSLQEGTAVVMVDIDHNNPRGPVATEIHIAL